MGQSANKTPAHVGFATIAIALMAIGLAAGLKILGMTDHLDRWIGTVMAKPGLAAPVNSLNPYLLWSATAIMALCLAAVMLNVSGNWRRLMIWGLTLILTLFWVPVLLLASYKPEIGVAVVGLVWSGCCAMVYSMNHAIPADLADINNTIQNDGPR
jgi:hypothetical protein